MSYEPQRIMWQSPLRYSWVGPTRRGAGNSDQRRLRLFLDVGLVRPDRNDRLGPEHADRVAPGSDVGDRRHEMTSQPDDPLVAFDQVLQIARRDRAHA